MQRLAVNGVDLAVVDEGQGMPVLFVHGFPLNHAMWQPQIDALRASHRVIAPDLRGFGQSGFRAGAGSHLLVEPRVSMEEFADDMNGLLDALGVNEPVACCGLSMGGYIGWQFARKYPRRLAKLIICDSRAEADAPEVAKGRAELAQRVLAEGSHVAADATIARLLAPKTLNDHPEVVDDLTRMIHQASRQGIAAALAGMAARTAATGLLPQISVPTLLIVGQHDAISTVDEMRAIAEQIPGARLVVIPDAGHMTPIENPAAFNQTLIEFLRT